VRQVLLTVENVEMGTVIGDFSLQKNAISPVIADNMHNKTVHQDIFLFPAPIPSSS
jgi:hypothetical protein